MKLSVILLAMVIFGFIGCTTQQPERQVMRDPVLVDITAELRRVPVPTPKVTPFDEETLKRESYLDGFRRGWADGITGMLHRVECRPPASLSADLVQSWTAGWQAGSQEGDARWWLELKEVLQRNRPSQGAAFNRRPAGQSDGSGNLAAAIAADRAFPAAVAELGLAGAFAYGALLQL